MCEGYPLASDCPLTGRDAFVLDLMDLSGVSHNTGIGLKKELQEFLKISHKYVLLNSVDSVLKC